MSSGGNQRSGDRGKGDHVQRESGKPDKQNRDKHGDELADDPNKKSTEKGAADNQDQHDGSGGDKQGDGGGGKPGSQGGQGANTGGGGGVLQ